MYDSNDTFLGHLLQLCFQSPYHLVWSISMQRYWTVGSPGNEAISFGIQYISTIGIST